MRLLLLLSLLAPLQAFAQVYSWREGDALRVSSQPPAWYSVEVPVRGPRVVVTVGRRVIDDTGLPMEKRLAMRPPLKKK